MLQMEVEATGNGVLQKVKDCVQEHGATDSYQ